MYSYTMSNSRDTDLYTTFGIHVWELSPALPEGMETDDGCDHYFHKPSGFYYHYHGFPFFRWTRDQSQCGDPHPTNYSVNMDQ